MKANEAFFASFLNRRSMLDGRSNARSAEALSVS